jgi:hypothetical protein
MVATVPWWEDNQAYAEQKKSAYPTGSVTYCYFVYISQERAAEDLSLTAI